MTIPYDLPAVPALNMIPRRGSPVTCPHCLDEGHACEDHPDFPWEGIWGAVEGHAEHGGIGMPCPHCCSPISEDGTVPIGLAFTPDWKRRDRLRLELVQAAQDKGATWASIAAVLGYPSGRQAKKAIHALGKRVQAAERLGSPS